MPRNKKGFQEALPRFAADLAERLADELRNSRDSGQPQIDETRFPTGKIRVNVIWDAWDRLPPEERTDTILRAYELAEGPAYRDQIALASGLTVPEAHAAGMLPFQILVALRKGDPVTLEECKQAMLEEGASQLFGPGQLQLRFATEEEAEACRQRLIRRLPPSEPVWMIVREVGRVEDWAEMQPAAPGNAAGATPRTGKSKRRWPNRPCCPLPVRVATPRPGKLCR
jgi:hypothetical protein